MSLVNTRLEEFRKSWDGECNVMSDEEFEIRLILHKEEITEEDEARIKEIDPKGKVFRSVIDKHTKELEAVKIVQERFHLFGASYVFKQICPFSE